MTQWVVADSSVPANQVAFWEKNAAHPTGEAFITGGGVAREVGSTVGITAAIVAGRLRAATTTEIGRGRVAAWQTVAQNMRGLYIPPGSMDHWQQQKAQAKADKTTQLVIGGFGDSILEGLFATTAGLDGVVGDYESGSFYKQFVHRETLDGVPLVSRYWPACHNAYANGGSWSYPDNSSPFWTIDYTTGQGGPAWAQMADARGMEANMALFPSSTPVNVNLMHFDTPEACTDLDISGMSINTVGHTVAISNAGPNASVTKPKGPGTVSNAAYDAGTDTFSFDFMGNISVRWDYLLAVTGLKNATHRVQFKNQKDGSGNPSSNGCNINGIVTYSGSRTQYGIKSAAHATSGQRLSTFWGGGAFGGAGVVNASYPKDKIAQFGGQQDDATRHGFGYPNSGYDLAILEFGINDCQFGTGIAAFRYWYERMILNLRSEVPDCSIIFVAVNSPSGLYSPSQTTFNNPERWKEFVEVMEELSEIHTCGMVNMQVRWGETAYERGFFPLNSAHPNFAGHRDMARCLYAVAEYKAA